MAFKKATKYDAKARIALIGASGTGKSLSGLLIASGLGERVAAIDTEHGSLSKYSDRVAFDVDELDSFAPHKYIEAIRSAESAGYDVLFIDSLSHAWVGKDGLLDQVDRSKGNKFTNGWSDATPQHLELIEAMHACKLHLLVSMRTKMDYILVKDDKGKEVPTKVGLAPVQRDGMEYEFDLVGDFDYQHGMKVTKSRIADLDGKYFQLPGKLFGEDIRRWLTGAKRLEPWEQAVALGASYKGALLSTFGVEALTKYIGDLDAHMKKHPETARAKWLEWSLSLEHAEQAKAAAVAQATPTTETSEGGDPWGLTQPST